MTHHDKIDQLSEQIRDLVHGKAESLAEAAIYNALNRTVSRDGVAFAVPSQDHPGSIAVVFSDVEGELSGGSGWQSGPENEPDAPPVLHVDPLSAARQLASDIACNGYRTRAVRRHSIVALEQSLRLASMVLRDTLEQIDRVDASQPPEPVKAELIDARVPGQLEFEVRVPVNVSIPPRCRTKLTDDQLIAEAARRCPLEFDALRTAMALQLSTLLERE